MAISKAERRILDTVSLDAPWALVEAFSVMPRWLPEDVNKGAITEVSGGSKQFTLTIGAKCP